MHTLLENLSTIALFSVGFLIAAVGLDFVDAVSKRLQKWGDK